MRSIVVTGVSGAGKSTLTAHAARALGMACYDFADLMLQADPSVPGKDALEGLDSGRRQAIYRSVEVLLDRWFGPGNTNMETVLLENHLSILHDGRIVTWPVGGYRRYNARGLAVVHAEPGAILTRRTGDATRNRRPGSVEEIAAQQGTNREQARLIAAHLRVPLLILENDALGGAAEALVRWVERLRS
ncbi:MAG: AAA family ATPase [Egibacteraceae bacterium]